MHQAITGIAKAAAQKKKLQIGTVVSARSCGDSARVKPRARARKNRQRTMPIIKAGQRSLRVPKNPSIPLPTNHQAGKQRIGVVITRSVSGAVAAGYHCAEPNSSNEARECRTNPGRL